MHVLYVDELFVENLIIDYILLIVTAKLTGIEAKRLRAALAAAFGGAYAVLAVLSGFELLTFLPFKLAVGVLMVLTVFGRAKRLLRVCLVFFGVSAGFAGAVMASALVSGEGAERVTLGQVSFGVLILAFALSYAVYTAVFRSIAQRQVNGHLIRVVVEHRGKRAAMTALVDTGNGLRDPVNGRPVLISSLDALSPLFGGQVLRVLHECPEALQALEALYEAGDHAFFLIPYASVGRDGMLLAFRAEGIWRDGKRAPGTVAIAPEGLGEGAGHAAIVGA